MNRFFAIVTLTLVAASPAAAQERVTSVAALEFYARELAQRDLRTGQDMTIISGRLSGAGDSIAALGLGDDHRRSGAVLRRRRDHEAHAGGGRRGVQVVSLRNRPLRSRVGAYRRAIETSIGAWLDKRLGWNEAIAKLVAAM